jgi:hypothetical protein
MGGVETSVSPCPADIVIACAGTLYCGCGEIVLPPYTSVGRIWRARYGVHANREVLFMLPDAWVVWCRYTVEVFANIQVFITARYFMNNA